MPDTADTSSNRPAGTAESSIRNALQALADRLVDGSKLTVTTSVQVLNATGVVSVASEKVEVARTEISVDGDRLETVPIILDGANLVVPDAVQALHEQHVSEALAYRQHMIELLVEFVKTRRLG